MKLKDKRSLTIIVLIIVIIIIIIVAIFNNVKFQRYEIEQKNFLSDITNFQIKLSFYLGSMSNDTFGAYTNEEIILGKKFDDENTEDNIIVPIVDSLQKVEVDGKIAFLINNENLKKVLNIDIKNSDNVSFYIQDGSIVKVKFKKVPKWWNNAMDIYMIK